METEVISPKKEVDMMAKKAVASASKEDFEEIKNEHEKKLHTVSFNKESGNDEEIQDSKCNKNLISYEEFGAIDELRLIANKIKDISQTGIKFNESLMSSVNESGEMNELADVTKKMKETEWDRNLYENLMSPVEVALEKLAAVTYKPKDVPQIDIRLNGNSVSSVYGLSELNECGDVTKKTTTTQSDSKPTEELMSPAEEGDALNKPGEVIMKVEDELKYMEEQLRKKEHFLAKAEQVMESVKRKLETVLTEKNEVSEKELATESIADTDSAADNPSSDEKSPSVDESELNDIRAGYVALNEKCVIYQEKIAALEADLKMYMAEQSIIKATNNELVEECMKLEIEKIALTRDEDYWKERVMISKSELDAKNMMLTNVQEEVRLTEARFEECKAEKSQLLVELHALKEELRRLSVHSKVVSLFSAIPLLILVIEMISALFPTMANPKSHQV